MSRSGGEGAALTKEDGTDPGGHGGGSTTWAIWCAALSVVLLILGFIRFFFALLETGFGHHDGDAERVLAGAAVETTLIMVTVPIVTLVVLAVRRRLLRGSALVCALVLLLGGLFGVSQTVQHTTAHFALQDRERSTSAADVSTVFQTIVDATVHAAPAEQWNAAEQGVPAGLIRYPSVEEDTCQLTDGAETGVVLRIDAGLPANDATAGLPDALARSLRTLGYQTESSALWAVDASGQGPFARATLHRDPTYNRSADLPEAVWSLDIESICIDDRPAQAARETARTPAQAKAELVALLDDLRSRFPETAGDRVGGDDEPIVEDQVVCLLSDGSYAGDGYAFTGVIPASSVDDGVSAGVAELVRARGYHPSAEPDGTLGFRHQGALTSFALWPSTETSPSGSAAPAVTWHIRFESECLRSGTGR